MIVVTLGKETTGEISEQKSILFEFAWWLKKEGYAEQTIDSRSRLIRSMLNKGADLNNPESIKEVIASQDWCEGRKRNAVHAYSSYLKMRGSSWDPPKYRIVQKIPWVPQETIVVQLIAGCPNKYKPFLQLLKETGTRAGEAWSLEWNDLDFAAKSVRITPKKGGNPRILPISTNLIAMLRLLPRNDRYVFKKGKQRNFTEGFRRHRKRISVSLSIPDISRITFKTFRHFKGTMEYQKTKDILHVKYVLGHKNIKNTLVYTHLIDFREDEFVSRIAKNAEEACQLIESGFEFVCQSPEGFTIFRKRK
jgi:integrase